MVSTADRDFAACHALNNKKKKIGKNRCLVFLNDFVLFRSMILSFNNC